jgi:hypothetical protein
MAPKQTLPSNDRLSQIVSSAQRERQQREASYRERALKLFPWICARCGREFAGKKLRELTVHHKDHNHDNNPPDGSNWELLCLYCHDNEHARHLTAEAYEKGGVPEQPEPSAGFKPFANLAALLDRQPSK